MQVITQVRAWASSLQKRAGRLPIPARMQLAAGMLVCVFLLSAGPMAIYILFEGHVRAEREAIMDGHDHLHALSVAFQTLQSAQSKILNGVFVSQQEIDRLKNTCEQHVMALSSSNKQVGDPDKVQLEKLLREQWQAYADNTDSLAEYKKSNTKLQATLDALRATLVHAANPNIASELLALELQHENFLQTLNPKPIESLLKQVQALEDSLATQRLLNPAAVEAFTAYRQSLPLNISRAESLVSNANKLLVLDKDLQKLVTSAHESYDKQLATVTLESTRHLRRAGFTVAIGGGFSMLFLVMVMRYLGRTMVQPLSRISSLVQELRRGNLEARHQSTTGDEIDMLGETLNELAESVRTNEQQLLHTQQELEDKLTCLAASETELRAHRENLEREVNERTKALSKTVNLLELQINRRKVMEEELVKARDAAEASNEAKSQFLANMSHEIRTPMNAIMGMSDLLLGTTMDAEQRDFAGIIRTSAESLLKVINDILDVSKIEAGKLDMEMVEFDLRQSLEELGDLMAYRAESKKVEYVVQLSPDLPEWVRGDPNRLRQVLINLSENAIKFTPKGAVVLNVSVDQRSFQDCTLRFTVTDSGIGIPKERMDRLFKPFSQVDASTTRRFGGTGLGLTISKSLVEMMGGKIGVDSEPNKGSTFWFTARFQASLQKAPPEPLCQHGGRYSFLVVDDISANRRLVREYLTTWGCSCDEASTGTQALEMLRSAASTCSGYRLVLLDGRLDDMDGEAIAAEIAKDPSLQGLSVIMLTSVGLLGETMETIQKLGISAVLAKPIKAKALHDTLSLLLGGGQTVATTQAGVGAHDEESAEPDPLDILLVEDNPFNQKLMLALLGKHKHKVDVAHNGIEALEILAKKRFDLVFMDVQMPEMDGFQATGIIRDRTSNVLDHDVPVVALTAHAMKGYREECLAHGMDDYLPKPTREADLLRVLASYTALRDRIDDSAGYTPLPALA